MIFRDRHSRLMELLDRQNIDAVFLAPSSDLAYITGLAMKPDSRLKGALLCADGRGFFLCPSLYRGEAEGLGEDLPIAEWSDRDGFREAFQAGLKRLGLGGGQRTIAFSRGIEAGDMLEAMAGLEARCVSGLELLAPLRSVKSRDEQEKMRFASRMNDAMMEAACRYIRPGISEADIIRFVENFHESHGGNPRVPGVATGVNTAKPHYPRDNNRVLETNDIVRIDSGGWYDGYSHDMTRTFFVGKPTDEQRAVYELVLEAQSAAEASAEIGSIPRDLDGMARGIIADAGYGDAFTHRLGHGIGMDGHEAPYISEANAVPLVEGNCFSIEPGVYLKGRFGVRIENLLMLAHGGKEVLNHFPKRLIAL
ncbi:Xaa-Pro peptidase family protein [bacterium]|nr:Xaa-Pro peptidase family protein [bacterium]